MPQVLIDNEKVESGDLEADWEFLPAKKIKDPNTSKPDDWDDKATIPDPDDTKPEDWDKPEHIPDPEATKPDDWDDEMDGEWEAPMIDNPDFKVRSVAVVFFFCTLLGTIFNKLNNYLCFFAIIRANGNPSRSTTRTTRDPGFIPKLITPSTSRTLSFINAMKSVQLVSICGKSSPVQYSTTFSLPTILSWPTKLEKKFGSPLL